MGADTKVLKISNPLKNSKIVAVAFLSCERERGDQRDIAATLWKSTASTYNVAGPHRETEAVCYACRGDVS